MTTFIQPILKYSSSLVRKKDKWPPLSNPFWKKSTPSTLPLELHSFSISARSLFPLLEKEMVTHSSILAWRIPGTEKPGRLQTTGSQRVRHDWVTNTSTSLFTCQPPCWITEKGLPDDNRGALSQPPPSTFQSCVYLPHLHGSFQANHLQQLITQIWKETEAL